ncbi:MAG: YbfB/YjiJ family MFS transporter, partial [Proteobacteria bacterium]|nr:YbfB/YjiJ family MFS transporter [Pseudomonadota bacterium]
QIGLLALLVARLAGPLGDTGAAAAVSLTTGCAIAGRLLVGLLPGESDWRVVAAANVLVQASGAALLWLGDAPAPLLLGCALFGLGFGNLISLPPLIAQAEFERVDVGRVVALTTAINQALFALAPGLFGALLDATGSYAAPLLAAIGLQILSAAIMLRGRR